MKKIALAIVLTAGTAGIGNGPTVQPQRPQEQYTATVQLFIDEPTPILLQRSRKIALKELENTFRAGPALESERFDLQVSPNGNQIFLRISSDEDIQLPVQDALTRFITRVEGIVPTHGRADVLRTSFSQPVEAVLDIELAEEDPRAPEVPDSVRPDVGKIRIKRMVVVNIPVADVLQRLKGLISRDRGHSPFGHSMDHHCLRRYIDFSFNEAGDQEPETLDRILEYLGDSLGIKVTNRGGFYVSTGACNPQDAPRRRPVPLDILSFDENAPPPGLDGMAYAGGAVGAHGAHPVNVHIPIPLMPLGRW